MCGYLDYNWEECTKEEYEDIWENGDGTIVIKKEPIFEDGQGILWQIDHDPIGYKYYKADKKDCYYVFLFTSKMMEEINQVIKDELLGEVKDAA